MIKHKIYSTIWLIVFCMLCLPVTAKVNYDLFYACDNGETEKVKKILAQSSAQVNDFDSLFELPLITAVKKGHMDIVKALVDAHADVNKKGKGNISALHAAVRGNKQDMAAFLLKAGALPETDDLSAAVLQRQPAMVNILLKAGMTMKNPANQKVWDVAVKAKNADIFKLLLQAGANPNAPLSGGTTTALISVIRDRKPELVQILLNAGAEVNLAGGGTTPLLEAIRYPQPLIVKQLLAAKADPNAADRDGTPLMYAATANELEIVKLLLAAGADVNQPLPNGKTVLQLIQGEKK